MVLFKEYLKLGQKQVDQGNWSQAEKFFNKAIELNPISSEAYLYLGDVFRYKKNLDEALSCYIKSTKINCDYVLPLGRIKRVLNHRDLSREQIEKINQFGEDIFKNKPHNRQVQSILVNSLVALGKSTEAREYSEQITYQKNLAIRHEFVKKYWGNNSSKKPNFMIIGFMKCGTIPLYDYMLKHPQILPSSQKEIGYYSNQNLLQMGIDWYRSNFPPIPAYANYVTGESSVSYIHNFSVAQRIKDDFPNTKFIVILRDPVARAISHYFFDQETAGYEVDFEKIVDKQISFFNKAKKADKIRKFLNLRHGIIPAGLYVYYLKEWMKIFPKHQFLILKTENLVENISATMSMVFDFLNLPNLPDYNIQQDFVINSKKYDSVSDELLNKLSEFYKPHNKILEEYLGVEFERKQARLKKQNQEISKEFSDDSSKGSSINCAAQTETDKESNEIKLWGKNFEDLNVYELDLIYTKAKKKLFGLHNWLLGSLHVKASARVIIHSLKQLGLSIKDKVYCDFGCGVQHPYAISTLMYINGASSAIATDLDPIYIEKRAAEALYDLLLQCLAHPDEYHLSDISRAEYFARIYTFNLQALKQGELLTGTSIVPIKHVVMSIYEPKILPESIDIMSSRAVFEHLLEFDKACNQLYSLMKPEGIGIHYVDFADHRAYRSAEHHCWSFLAEEEEEWLHKMKDIMPLNRLRPSEIYKFIEESGFEIINYSVQDSKEMPADFRANIRGRFASMSDAELNTLRAQYVIQKSQ